MVRRMRVAGVLALALFGALWLVRGQGALWSDMVRRDTLACVAGTTCWGPDTQDCPGPVGQACGNFHGSGVCQGTFVKLCVGVPQGDEITDPFPPKAIHATPGKLDVTVWPEYVCGSTYTCDSYCWYNPNQGHERWECFNGTPNPTPIEVIKTEPAGDDCDGTEE